MLVTQKNQYAIRAIYELAHRRGQGPIKIADIAKAQAIPIRFLEVILSQLKRSGWLKSKRGYEGGYKLLKSPAEISIGDVLRFMEKSSKPVSCSSCVTKSNCPFDGQCVFMPLWDRVERAITSVYDETSFQDLLEDQASAVPATPKQL